MTAPGPVEWVAVVFPGATLDPRVVPPVKQLVDAGTVRLLDSAVVHKADDGTVTEAELDSEGLRDFDAVDGDVLELLSTDDLAAIGDGLAPGTTSLVLVWENLWASAFAAAIREAGGTVAASERVAPARAAAALGVVGAQEGSR